MRPAMMSGHCQTPQTENPELSHGRCQRNGGGNTANPRKEFGPCPCACHFPGERYECECGGLITEAPHWPLDGEEIRYTHLDPVSGNSIGEDCNTKQAASLAPPVVFSAPAKQAVKPVYYEPANPVEMGDTGDEDFDALLAELDEEI